MSKDLTTKDEGAIAAAVAQMNDELREVYLSGMKRRTELAHHGVMEKYDMGSDFVKVMASEKKYGADAAGLLATAWDVHSSEVYAYRHIALAWERPEMEKLLKRRTTAGGMIHIAHLSLLAGITKQALRESLTNKVFTASLTLKELSAIVQAKLGARGNNRKGRGVITPRSPQAGLAKLCKMAQTLLASQPGIEESVFDKLASEPAKYANEVMLAQLSEADKEFGELSDVVVDNKRKVAAALDTISKTMQNSAKAGKSGRVASRVAAKKPGKATKKAISDKEDLEEEPQVDAPAASNGHRSHAATAAKAAKAAAAAKKRKKQKLQTV